MIENKYARVVFQVQLEYSLRKASSAFSRDPIDLTIHKVPRGSCKPILEAINRLNASSVPFGIEEISEESGYSYDVIHCYYESYGIFGDFFTHDFG